MDEENKKNTDGDKELKATCIECGFSTRPEEFNTCLSAYNDLRCPKCGTTNIDWTYGNHKDDTLIL